MKKWLLLLIACPVWAAATVPGRYIVELDTPSLAENSAQAGPRRLDMRSAAVQSHRLLLRRQQQRVRPLIEQASGEVVGSLETVANAFIVQIDDSKADSLRRLTGVRHVHHVRYLQKLLDHALALHRVPDAWAAIGGQERAGAGIKIGLLDTGVDIGHPGFQDPSLAAPAGFPQIRNESDRKYTNSKVIVARSYVNLLPTRDSDLSARDDDGHGTATAMCAAGVTSVGPQGTITGVAPKAWIGSYKVFGSPGQNDGTTDDVVLRALDDAVADGMDVISMSLGGYPAPRVQDDPEVEALENVVRAGVIVVVAAGNDGPDGGTVASPATAPSVISVGATRNDRRFGSLLTLGDGQTLSAQPGAGSIGKADVTAGLVDLVSLGNNDGMACDTLPTGTLQGKVVLILRGVCTFDVKLANVQRAGAIAGLLYTDAARPEAATPGTSSGGLPSVMVSYSDGVGLKDKLANSNGNLTVTLRFIISSVPGESRRIAGFSARGPSFEGLKPDLLATGADLYLATEKSVPSTGSMYDASGFTLADGTSFSAPIVAGAAALLKAARPGLTPQQYRSLLVNNTAAFNVDGSVPSVTQTGSGVLDVSAALRATAVMQPSLLSFDTGGPDPQVPRTFRLTNVGTRTETYQLTVAPNPGSTAPALDRHSVTLDPGASQDLLALFSAGGLTPGSYEGVIRILANETGVESRVPYWYAIPTAPQSIVLLDQTTSSLRAGANVRDGFIFRVLDGSGLVLSGIDPVVTVLDGGGRVVRVRDYDYDTPGAYGVSVQLGPQAGTNVFQVQAGNVKRTFSLTAK